MHKVRFAAGVALVVAFLAGCNDGRPLPGAPPAEPTQRAAGPPPQPTPLAPAGVPATPRVSAPPAAPATAPAGAASAPAAEATRPPAGTQPPLATGVSAAESPVIVAIPTEAPILAPITPTEVPVIAPLSPLTADAAIELVVERAPLPPEARLLARTIRPAITAEHDSEGYWLVTAGSLGRWRVWDATWQVEAADGVAQLWEIQSRLDLR